jgi:NifB/MoaA-like Fe-S oxidoreductase
MDAARARSYRERGTGWLYAGDELFFIAEAPMPEAAYYDDWPLTENGVGAVRRLLDDFEVNAGSVRRLEGRRIAIVTGERMAPVLSPLAARLSVQTGASIDVVPVANRLFGPTVTTAGLLAGRDIEAVLATQPAFDLVLLPAESLNDDAMFIDSVPLAELEAAFAPAILLPAHELTAALASQ